MHNNISNPSKKYYVVVMKKIIPLLTMSFFCSSFAQTTTDWIPLQNLNDRKIRVKLESELQQYTQFLLDETVSRQ